MLILKSISGHVALYLTVLTSLVQMNLLQELIYKKIRIEWFSLRLRMGVSIWDLDLLCRSVLKTMVFYKINYNQNNWTWLNNENFVENEKLIICLKSWKEQLKKNRPCVINLNICLSQLLKIFGVVNVFFFTLQGV